MWLYKCNEIFYEHRKISRLTNLITQAFVILAELLPNQKRFQPRISRTFSDQNGKNHKHPAFGLDGKKK